MSTVMKETFFAKKESVDHKWFVVDATDRPVGKLATEIARILRGKHKPIFTPQQKVGK